MIVKAIFGPPGTGKTRRLVDIAHKEAERVGKSVLCLSYTKAAAEEIVSRAKDQRVRPSTIHSFAFNALNLNRAAIVDKDKRAEFGRSTGIPFMGSEKGSDEPQEGDDYLTVLEYANNRIIPPHEAWDKFGRPGTQTRFENFLESYADWKKTFGYIDFDDMLKLYTQSTTTSRQAGVVLLDEAQDCTPQQWLAFIRICENAKRVYIAGDDDQAIYEWSGANPHGMRDFADSHEGSHIEILDQSWRVPSWPHELSQSLIKQVDNRVQKEFKPKAGAPGLVVKHGDIWKIDLHKFAKSGGGMILVRDQFRRKEIERDLNRAMVPYDVLGATSPWTNRTAQALRNGQNPEIPAWWIEFYRQWDPNAKVNITVSTIHQAKGRESPRVIVDLSITPRVEVDLYRNRDAEVRVWYVAVTRTAGELHLCGGNPIL